MALAVAGLVVVSCSADLGVGAGTDGGSLEEAGVDAVAVDDGATADAVLVVDAADAADARDADADAGPVYAGNHLWSKIYGQATTVLQDAGIATGPKGESFVAGSFTGTVDLGGGPLASPVGEFGCYFGGLDKSGVHLWSKVFGVAGCGPIASDATGVYLAGAFSGSVDFGGGALVASGSSNLFMAKFDHAGAHLWSRRFVSSSSSFSRIATLGNDVVFVGSRTAAGSVDFGGGALTGPGSSFLVRLTGAAGDHVWSKQSAGSGMSSILAQRTGLATDPVGNIIVASGLSSTVDWGGGVLTAVGDYDALVLKFDGVGNLLWTKQMSGPTRESAQDVAVNAAGEIYVVGVVSGNSSIDFGLGQLSPVNPTTLPDMTTFVAKLAPNGSGVWQKIFSTDGPTVNAWPRGVAVDGAGNVIVTGEAYTGMNFGGGAVSATAGKKNIFVAKVDGAGQHLWSKGWASSAGSGGGQELAVDLDGNVLLSGYLRTTTIDMGGGPLTAVPNGASGERILAKFGP